MMRNNKNVPPISRPKHIGERPMSMAMPFGFLGGMILAFWLTTEYFGFRLHFNPSLGRPLLPYLYEPFHILVWLNEFYQPIPHAFHKPFLVYPKYVYDQFTVLPYVAGASLVIGTVFAALVSVGSISSDDNTGDIYDAGGKFADEATAKQDKLLGAECGPIIGGFNVGGKIRALRYPSELGLEYTEPPGGGKSSLLKSNLLIPLAHRMARTWTAAQRRLHPWGEEPIVVVSDPKFELFRETSGFQKTGLQKVIHLLAPLGVSENLKVDVTQLACYNPLWNARIGTVNGVRDCLDRTTYIIDPEGKGLESHWDRTALSWAAAVIEKLAYRAVNMGDPEIFSIPGLLDYIAQLGNISGLLEDMMNTPDDPAGVCNWTMVMPDGRQVPTLVKPSILQAARDMANKEAREQSSVHSSFIAFLAPFRNESLRRYITKSTFNWKALANDPKRSAAVYLGIDPMDLPKARGYLRMVTQSALDELTSGGTADMNGRSARGNLRPAVFVMDEFFAWKKMQEIEHGSGYFRGYGIFLWLIWQSVAQRRLLYKENLISETMGVLLFGRPKTPEGAKEIQAQMGERVELVKKRSLAGNRFAIIAPQAQDSLEPVRLPLMSTKEISQIDATRYIGFINGHTYFLEKWEYFKDRMLAPRAKIPYPKTFRAKGAPAYPEPLFLQHIRSELTSEQVAAWNDVITARVAQMSAQAGITVEDRVVGEAADDAVLPGRFISANAVMKELRLKRAAAVAPNGAALKGAASSAAGSGQASGPSSDEVGPDREKHLPLDSSAVKKKPESEAMGAGTLPIASAVAAAPSAASISRLRAPAPQSRAKPYVAHGIRAASSDEAYRLAVAAREADPVWRAEEAARRERDRRAAEEAGLITITTAGSSTAGAGPVGSVGPRATAVAELTEVAGSL
jgi:type IV secretion system protein VirD4